MFIRMLIVWAIGLLILICAPTFAQNKYGQCNSIEECAKKAETEVAKPKSPEDKKFADLLWKATICCSPHVVIIEKEKSRAEDSKRLYPSR